MFIIEGTYPIYLRIMSNNRQSIPNDRQSIPNGRHGIPNGRHSIPNGRHNIPNGRHNIPNVRYSISNGRYSIPNFCNTQRKCIVLADSYGPWEGPLKQLGTPNSQPGILKAEPMKTGRLSWLAFNCQSPIRNLCHVRRSIIHCVKPVR